MTDNRDQGGAFAGAQRAQGYVEADETITKSELQRQLEEERAAQEPRDATTIQPMPEAAPPDEAQRPAVQPAVVVEPVPPAPAAPVDGGAAWQQLAAPLKAAPATIAKRGVRGALGKVGIKLAPGAAERAELDAERADERNRQIVRQATWTKAVSVLVANPKGGTGKTPVALMLGGTLAAIRGGSVAVIEVSDDPGALTFRAEGNPQRGIGELVADVESIRSAGQLAGYTAPQTSFAAVIGSARWRRRLEGADVRAVSNLIDEYYAIRVMDSGNQPSSSAFRGALDTADTLVVPVLNAGDSVLEAVNLMDELRRTEHGYRLASRAVLVRLTDGRPEHPQVIERIDRIIAGAQFARTIAVPFDPHIAERGELTLDALRLGTRRAFNAIAAAVVENLQTA